ncbi:NrtA/SsuA/CpmA family ABC transporter substrate-binding protein [Halostagnicola bangensis]
MSYLVPPDNGNSLMAVPEIQEELDHLGEEYELDPQQDQATPDAVTAIAADELDIATLTPTSYASAITNDAVPGGMMAVASDYYDAHPDYYGQTLFSHPDSDIEEIQDLEDTYIGVNALETESHLLCLSALESEGLSEDDVEFVEQPMPTYTEGMEEGVLDAGLLPASFGSEAIDEGFNEVFTSQEIKDEPYPFAFICISQNTVEENESAVEAWVDDYSTAINYALENRSDLIATVSEHFDRSEEAIDSYWLTDRDFYRESLDIDTDALQNRVSELEDFGFIEESFDVSDHVSNDYIQSS